MNPDIILDEFTFPIRVRVNHTFPDSVLSHTILAA